MRGVEGSPVERGQPVGLEPGTGDREVVMFTSILGVDHNALPLLLKGADFLSQPDLPACLADVVGEGVGDSGVVNDGRSRRVQCRDSDGVRLYVLDLLCAQHPGTGHTVSLCPDEDVFKPPVFFGSLSDDQLSALIVGEVLGGAVFLQQVDSTAAQGGLESAWLIVETGMHHSGVVARLVVGQFLLLLVDRNRRAVELVNELTCNGDTDDATADDGTAQWLRDHVNPHNWEGSCPCENVLVDNLERADNLTDQAITRLRTAILGGELKPGELYSATQLGEWLGVSRTPIREALQQLATTGLVVVERNKGMRVRSTTLEDLVEVFQVRLMLEVPVARRAAAVRTAADICRVTEAFDAFQRELRNR